MSEIVFDLGDEMRADAFIRVLTNLEVIDYQIEDELNHGTELMRIGECRLWVK